MGSLLAKLLAPIKLHPALTTAIATAIVVSSWVLFATPYLRFAGQRAELRFACVPEVAEVVLRSKFTSIDRAELDLVTSSGRFQVGRLDVRPAVSDPRIVSITTPEARRAEIARKELSAGQVVLESRLLLYSPATPSFDVSGVDIRPLALDGPVASTCPSTGFHGSGLANLVVLARDVQLKRTNVLTEFLADRIYELNDLFGNVLLGVLCCAFISMLWHVASAIRAIPWSVKAAERAVRELANQRPNSNLEALKEELSADYVKNVRWLQFWKLVGPALGFLLTVSSLSAALHPAVRTASNAYFFIASIQLAIVSTCLGLLVRLAAQGAVSARWTTTRRLAEALPKQFPSSEPEHAG